MGIRNGKKRIVITGASSGLGRCLAQAFLEQQHTVIGLSRREIPESDLPQGKYHHIVADVSDHESVAAAFAEINATHAGVDVLFNNAAVYSKVSFLEESPQAWMHDIAVNLGGVSNCCKSALPLMIQSGYGRIYNVGSFADYAPSANSSAYSTSKGGLHALTKSIAVDIAHLDADIEVHEWIPGHLNTQMSDYTGIDPAISAGWAAGIVEADAASAASVVFENDRELVMHASLKRRVLNKVAFWN